MKFIYLVNYWVPFPSSEYGGLITVIAEDEQECFDLLANYPHFDSNYSDKIMENVSKAIRYELKDSTVQSEIIDVFLT